MIGENMRISNSERKLNNKGFSLMELIVVVAIMIVMVGAAAVTVSMLDSSYVEDAERGIKDYIALGRTKSMSVSAKDWYMSVVKDGSDYYACLYKVVEEPISDNPDAGVEEKVYIVEKKKLGNKLTIEFGTTDDNKIDINFFILSSKFSISRVVCAKLQKKLVLSHKESIIANIIGVFKQLFRRETLNLQELLMTILTDLVIRQTE